MLEKVGQIVEMVMQKNQRERENLNAEEKKERQVIHLCLM